MSSVVQAISDFVENGPLYLVYPFLFIGVSIRGLTTYGIGRYMDHFVMTRGKPKDGWRLKAYNWIRSSGTQRGIEIVRRRGWPAVTLCWLTVGLQTAILIGAGVVRMSAVRFTLAMIPGTLAWAAIYSTIGFALWRATVLAALGSPIGIAVLVGLIALIVLLIYYYRTKKKRLSAHSEMSDEPVFGTSLDGAQPESDGTYHTESDSAQQAELDGTSETEAERKAQNAQEDSSADLPQRSSAHKM